MTSGVSSSCVGADSGGLCDASLVLETVGVGAGRVGGDLVLAQCAVRVTARLPHSFVDRLRRMLAHGGFPWQAMSAKKEMAHAVDTHSLDCGWAVMGGICPTHREKITSYSRGGGSR